MRGFDAISDNASSGDSDDVGANPVIVQYSGRRREGVPSAIGNASA